MLLARILRSLMHTGTLTIVDAGGRSHRIETATPGPDVTSTTPTFPDERA